MAKMSRNEVLKKSVPSGIAVEESCRLASELSISLGAGDVIAKEVRSGEQITEPRRRGLWWRGGCQGCNFVGVACREASFTRDGCDDPVNGVSSTEEHTLGSSPSKSRNPLQHSPDAQGDLGGQECNPVGHLSICESGRQSLPALVLLFIFFWRCGGSSGRGSAFCLAARLGSWRFASVVVSERDELGMGRSVEEADRDTKRSQLAKAGGSKPISDLRGTEGAFACDQLCEASPHKPVFSGPWQ
ncbi:hypothetical protein TEQG_06111 [Trichophyton equinum CBS 127.97]|uniref:Uncharacterized protein n=1 Tax=Trichophyton equinum (strain ATCC MYA-4606 / CBS 127.97) TaxID=559882 RepID=F2PZ05_TRIEC|nr:hypothetical protein TEQG_06111 [Trichophyton equinum CBS 127.97]